MERAALSKPAAHSTKISPEGGPDKGRAHATLNIALADKPEYAVLFEKLTPAQVAAIQRQIPIWWAAQWLVILGHCAGIYNKFFMSFFMILAFGRWGFGVHDTNHLSPLPWPYRFGMATFIGFTPLPCTWSDLTYDHIFKHHPTKAALDAVDGDWDSKWSERPLLVSIALLLLQPSEFSAWEIAAQWWGNPSGFWLERVLLGLFYYAELYVLYLMDPSFVLMLWVLATGHISCVLLFLLFHAMTHRQSYYDCLIAWDPSGLRHVPYVDAVFNVLLPPGGWMDMKFHDVHHAFGNSIGTLSSRAYLGQWKKIEEAAANIVDEGLYLDDDGDPMSHLAYSGHKVGTRKQYLRQLSTSQGLGSSLLSGA